MSHVVQTADVAINQTMADTVLNIVPDNPFNSLANGDMLPVIIFGLLTGIILAKLKNETKLFNDFFKEGNRIMMEMTSIVMKFAPIGVFCLMAKTFGSLGIEGILPLSKYFVCVLIGLAIQAFVVYPSLLVIFTRLNPIHFFRKFMPVIFFAFSFPKTNACVPFNEMLLKILFGAFS